MYNGAEELLCDPIESTKSEEIFLSYKYKGHLELHLGHTERAEHWSILGTVSKNGVNG